MNQCDGCARRLPIVNGIHMDGKLHYMMCTAALYTPDDKVFKKLVKKRDPEVLEFPDFDDYEDLSDYGDH